MCVECDLDPWVVAAAVGAGEGAPQHQVPHLPPGTRLGEGGALFIGKFLC